MQMYCSYFFYYKEYKCLYSICLHFIRTIIFSVIGLYNDFVLDDVVTNTHDQGLRGKQLISRFLRTFQTSETF